MKSRTEIILALTYFVLINTAYWWMSYLSVLGMFVMLALAGCYLVMCILLLIRFVQFIRMRFRERARVISTVVATAVLVLVAFFPRGILNWDKIEGRNLLIVEREGGGNCMVTLKLKENNKFTLQSVCFGIERTRGTYSVNGDTVFFSPGMEYEYGVFLHDEHTDTIYGIATYRNKTDTVGLCLWITHNELNDQKSAGQ